MKANKSNHSTLPKRKATYVAVASCMAMSNALANPYGYDVVNGIATFHINGNTLTIANTPNAIINWQSFSIDANETVRFIQESSASAVLNRVLGGDPSVILGTLTSNGKVFLINPSGVVFGAGSQINTAGLVASSLDITNEDFLTGKLRFNASTLTPGSVVNHGEITTPQGGFVYLIAPNVENTGVITTPSGEAILVAGNSVELVDSVSPTQRVVVSAQTADINLSQLMQQAGGNIFKVLNSGHISANSAVVGENGKIYLRSAGSIETTDESKVESKGLTEDTDGGFLQALANNQGVFKGLMDVSGRNGGFIETSAAYLDVNNLSISTLSSRYGAKNGTWLIDPTDIYIMYSGTDDCGTGPFNCSGDSSVILNTTIEAALIASNVVISTAGAGSGNGDIYVTASINSSSTNSLTLTANNDVFVADNIQLGGDLTVNASNGTVNIGSLSDTLPGILNVDDLTVNAQSLGFASIDAFASNMTFNLSDILQIGNSAAQSYTKVQAQNNQTVNYSSSSSAMLYVIGSDTGSNNSASFTVVNGLQQIGSASARPDIQIQAGNGTGNDALIGVAGSTATQNIFAQSLTISSSLGANSASAGVSASSVSTNINATGTVGLYGPDTSPSSSQLAAAYIGSNQQATKISITANKLELDAGGVSTGPGALIGSIGYGSDINIQTTGDVVVTANNATTPLSAAIGSIGSGGAVTTITIHADELNTLGKTGTKNIMIGGESVSGLSEINLAANSTYLGDGTLLGFTDGSSNSLATVNVGTSSTATGEFIADAGSSVFANKLSFNTQGGFEAIFSDNKISELSGKNHGSNIKVGSQTATTLSGELKNTANDSGEILLATSSGDINTLTHNITSHGNVSLIATNGNINSDGGIIGSTGASGLTLIEATNGSINLSSELKATGSSGVVDLFAYSDINLFGATTANGGGINITSTNGSISINQNIRTNGGDLTLSANTLSGGINVGSYANENYFDINTGAGEIEVFGANMYVTGAGIISDRFEASLTQGLYIGDTSTSLKSFIESNSTQDITAAYVRLQGGNSAANSTSTFNLTLEGTNDGPAESYLLSKGDQYIKATNSIELLGGSNGEGNSAYIKLTGSGIQSIDSDYSIYLYAGSAKNADAFIEGGSGTQDISSVYLDIYGSNTAAASAGIDTAGVKSTIDISSSLNMQGGSSSSTSPDDFSAAYIGSDSRNVNLVLNAGSITVNAGTVSGVNPGAVIGAIGKNATIKIHASNYISIGSYSSQSSIGALIGAKGGNADISIDATDGFVPNLSVDGSTTSAAMIGATGSGTSSKLSINTNGYVSLGDNSKLGFTTATNENIGTVDISVDSVYQSGNLAEISANKLILDTNNGTNLYGNANKFAIIDAENTNYGDIALNNTKNLSIESIRNSAADGGEGGGNVFIQNNGNIIIGANGIQAANAELRSNSGNIRGSGMIDLSGTGTATLYASNVIGTVTKSASGTTYTPVYVNAANINASNSGDYIIIGNAGTSLSSVTLGPSESVLKDAVFVTTEDLIGTSINSTAQNTSILGRSGAREFTNVTFNNTDGNLLVTGSKLIINNSYFSAENIDLVATELLMNDSESVANDTTTAIASKITLDNSRLIASNNVFVNTGSGILGNAPGSAAINNLLSFASNSAVSATNGSYIEANNNVGILAGSLALNGSHISASNEVIAAVKNNLTITGGADGGEGFNSAYIFGGEEVRLAVGGKLSLKSGDDGSSAYVSAGSVETIYLDFPSSGGSFEVDGKANALSSSQNEGTGFFTNGEVAVLGDTLKVRYGSQTQSGSAPSVVTTLINQTTNDIVNSTTKTNTVVSNATKSGDTKSTEEKFFDSGKEDKNNKKSQPKQCS